MSERHFSESSTLPGVDRFRARFGRTFVGWSGKAFESVMLKDSVPDRPEHTPQFNRYPLS